MDLQLKMSLYFVIIIVIRVCQSQCLIGSACQGFVRPCNSDCNPIDNDDTGTITCQPATLDGTSDINACCIPSIRGRNVSAVIPPSCGVSTLPDSASSGIIIIYIYCVMNRIFVIYTAV